MALQTTYPAAFALGFEGQLADGGSDRHSETRVNTTVEMSFGRAVVRHASNDNEVEVPSTGNVNFEGITHHTHAVELGSIVGTATEGIPEDKPANILRKGRIVVLVEEAVTPADSVFFRHNAPGALPEALGRFRTDADAGDATAVASARFVTSAAAGELAVLEINLP